MIVVLAIGLLIYFLTRKKKEVVIDEGPPGSYERDMQAIQKPLDINAFSVKQEASEMEGVHEMERELENFDDGFKDDYDKML